MGKAGYPPCCAMLTDCAGCSNFARDEEKHLLGLKKILQFGESIILARTAPCSPPLAGSKKVTKICFLLFLDRLMNRLAALTVRMRIVKLAVEADMEIAAACWTLIPDMDPGCSNFRMAENTFHLYSVYFKCFPRTRAAGYFSIFFSSLSLAAIMGSMPSLSQRFTR